MQDRVELRATPSIEGCDQSIDLDLVKVLWRGVCRCLVQKSADGASQARALSYRAIAQDLVEH
jgi:hypothetical protein